MSVSVCMATYNGEKFIFEQLDSIVKQLSPKDEIIIVDDCSKDNTIKIIESFNFENLKIYQNDKNRGVNFSFGRAIFKAQKDIIFLSDQDDIWAPERVHQMVKKINESGCNLITSNFQSIDNKGLDFEFPVDGVHPYDSEKHFKNIIDIFIGKTNYYGCAMAFKKEIVSLICPIPSYVESHDLWVALVGNLIKSNIHIDDISLFKRAHDNNATETNRKLYQKLWSRVIFLRSIFEIKSRISNKKFTLDIEDINKSI